MSSKPIKVGTKSQVAVSSTGITAQFIMVDPVMAQEFLDLNTQNRKVKDGRVDAIRSDLREGRWVEDGTPVRFGQNGLLQDGQHRLMAILAEKATKELLVVGCLSQEALDVIDSGAKRTVGDTLGMNGIAHGNRVAAIVNILISIDRLPKTVALRQARTLSTVSKSEQIDYARAHPEIEESIRELSSIVRKVAPLSPGAVCAAYVRMAAVDGDEAYNFLHMIAHPERGITDIPGVYPLHLTLKNQRTRLLAEVKRRPMAQVALIWRAWLDYREDKAVGTQAYKTVVNDRWITVPDQLY